MTKQVIVPATPLRQKPLYHGPLETELLLGERFIIEGEEKGWVYGRTELDDYPGFVRFDALGEPKQATHRVRSLKVPVYFEPDFKRFICGELHMNSLVCVEQGKETPEGEMLFIPSVGWVFATQLMPVGTHEKDFVAQAMKFRGMPYAWGKRTDGVDCSALVQASFIAAGIPCPRDCIPQSRSLGSPIPFDPELPIVKRGDLVFWTEGKGRHVAIMVDFYLCVHATIASPYRSVVVQPLAEVMRDQANSGCGPITGVRRLLANWIV